MSRGARSARALPRTVGAGLVAFLAVAAAARGAPPAVEARPMHAPKELFHAPRTYPAPGFTSEGVKALFYDGPAWKGRPTRVFAWVGLPKVEPGHRVPGMVLVHGGGGTAFDYWVRLWTRRGYAAIAMDTCGCVPRGTYGHWERNEAGGPPGWGGFDQVDQPITDQWPYHATSDVILAHSLLRSMPEVDPDRIGITGISWGGYLTCLVSGLDSRFRFAVPVYGCGSLGEDSAWAADLRKMGPSGERWLATWDPSHYLPHGRMPKLWVTGTNDFAYPMDSLQKSYRAAGGRSTLCLRLRMVHGHGGPGENPEEIHAFADSLLMGGKPLLTVTEEGERGRTAWARFRAPVPVTRAELLYTRDLGPWQQRTWQTAPARLEAGAVTARIPDGTTVYFLNLIDERGLIVSTPHREMAGSHAAGAAPVSG